MSARSSTRAAPADDASGSGRFSALVGWAARAGLPGGGALALGGMLVVLTGQALLGLFAGVGSSALPGARGLAWLLVGSGGLLAVAGFVVTGAVLWSRSASATGESDGAGRAGTR